MASLMNADVIVIGCGGSGLTAAITAAEKGAKVVILESRAVAGGTTNFASGIFAVQSTRHKEFDIQLTTDDVFSRLMEYSHYRSNATLTRAIIDRSASTIDWLREMGVEFIGPPMGFGPKVGLPTFNILNGGGLSLVKAFVAKAKEIGVSIYYKAIVKALLKSHGRIDGVSAIIDGEEVEISGRAIILGTGGYASNDEWVRQYTGFRIGQDLFPSVNVGLKGEALAVAWEAGAAKDGMGLLEVEYDITGPGLRETQLRMVVYQPFLWVNRQGERLGNEEQIAANPNYGGNVLSRQASKEAFLIFDAETKNQMETIGFPRWVPPPRGTGDKLVCLDTQILSAMAAGNTNVFKVDSLEDLCAKTGIAFNGLQETLTTYNHSADQKAGDQFGKVDACVLQPIRKPPFYALRINATMLGTLGGIKVNHNLEALDDKDNAIQGLYAVGNIASGMYGDTYCIVVPGMTLGFAINSGRIAGEHAAAMIFSGGRLR